MAPSTGLVLLSYTHENHRGSQLQSLLNSVMEETMVKANMTRILRQPNAVHGQSRVALCQHLGYKPTKFAEEFFESCSYHPKLSCCIQMEKVLRCTDQTATAAYDGEVTPGTAHTSQLPGISSPVKMNLGTGPRVAPSHASQPVWHPLLK